jgi:hypothetical protein
MNLREHDQPYEPMNDKIIAELAYAHWEKRGRPLGTPDRDWYWAIQEFNEQRAGRTPPTISR